MIRLILYFLAVILLSLFIFSIFQIRSHPGEAITFIYSWVLPLGAFVWEDLLIFSFFYFIVVIITLWRQDLRIFLLFFLVFWIIRSSGETLYWFFQQFNQPTQYPHNQFTYEEFNTFKAVLGNISNQRCFILMQVFWQGISSITITVLILLVINWKNLDQLNKGFKKANSS